MLVLHTIWNDKGNSGEEGEVLLWAEATGQTRRGTRAGDASPDRDRAHPFAASYKRLWEELALLIQSFLPDGSVPSGKPAAFSMLLPSRDGRPLPSPELLGDPSPEDNGGISGPVLQRWAIKGLKLPVSEAVPFLASLPAGTSTDPFLMVPGADSHFWIAVSRFALELLARGRFLPSISTPMDGAVHAVWEPLLRDPADKEKVERLTRAMPPVSRALLTRGEEDRRPSSPEGLLSSFLRSAVDGLARHWLGESPPGGLYNLSSTPATRWLRSLWSPSGAVPGTAFELKTLRRGVEGWAAPMQAAQEKNPFRTCFRLEPPLADEDGEGKGVETPDPRARSWVLHFLLQATDDPSLLVEAGRVWQERGGTLQYLNRRFQQPQERLLADLGRAARLFPQIEESLRSARPESSALTGDEAYQFLTEAGPLLEEAGFGVLVPNWWEKRAARPQLGVRLKMSGGPGQGLMGADAIIQYNWQLALGDQPISRAEFDRLAALKTPLVRVRGQWVELDPELMQRARRLWGARRNSGEISLGEALRLALAPDGGDGLEVTAVETEGWLTGLLNRLGEGERVATLPQPDGFSGGLRPYQLRGLSWLAFLRQWGFGSCLADDMGLGKTIQLIALLLYDLERGEGKRPVLLICPTSVIGNWEREVERFGPSLRALVHHGPGRRTEVPFAEAVQGYDLVISSYGLSHRDEEELTSVEWEGVVLDEAQNVKNPSTKQSQAIRKLRAGYRVALTGTPVENRLSELWSIFEFLNPGYLGSFDRFRKEYALPIERWRDRERSERLRKLVQPFILRRVKTDPKVIQDLPEKMEMKVFCTLTPEQATLYEAVVRDMLRQIEESDGMQRKGLVLSTLLRLKQVCNHPAHYLGDNSALPERSGKLARLEEMLEEALAEGDRALIFTQFAEFGARLRSHLQERLGREAIFLHGGVAQKARDRMVARFQEDPAGPPIFILSLKAGGVGLNLTRANHVFHYDRWWNPAVENQATDRAFRIGQRKNVQVHKLMCAGTLEERIDDLIESKKGLADSVIGGGESWLTELTTNQLRDLLTLRK
jgi:SNF2 family DNA or RNA helicase